jgi:hypothetical protein
MTTFQTIPYFVGLGSMFVSTAVVVTAMVLNLRDWLTRRDERRALMLERDIAREIAREMRDWSIPPFPTRPRTPFDGEAFAPVFDLGAARRRRQPEDIA